MTFSTSDGQLWYYEENYVFRVLAQEYHCIVDCSTKEHRFWPRPSSTPSFLEKKNRAEEDTISLVILEKEVSNNSCEPLNFLLLTDKKTAEENSIENSDSLKYV